MLELKDFTVGVRRWQMKGVAGGQGPLLLFIHGIGLSYEWWIPTMESLAEEFSVAAVDLPGSGRSSALSEIPPPDSYQWIIEAVLRELDSGEAVVVGHSLGGYVATEAALAGTVGIRSLVLVDPFGFGPVENVYFKALSYPKIGSVLARSGKVGVRKLLESLIFDDDELLEDMVNRTDQSPSARKQFLLQLQMGIKWGRTSSDYIREEAVKGLPPTLLLWGRHDSVFSAQTALAAQRVLREPELVFFENSGHMPQLEEPELFSQLVGNFARRTLK